MSFHVAFLLVALTLLTGCSVMERKNAPRLPIPKESEIKTFTETYTSVAQSRPASEHLSLLKVAVTEYHQELFKNASGRIQSRWEHSDMTTYGGLAAVVGSLAEKVALTNVGAAIAVLGAVSSNQYQVGTQATAYTTALRQVSCISGKVNAVQDAELDLAKSITDDPATAGAANNFVVTAMLAVDTVRQTYLNTLFGVTPTSVSQAELAGQLAGYRAPPVPPESMVQHLIGQAAALAAEMDSTVAEIARLESADSASTRSLASTETISRLKGRRDAQLDEMAKINRQIQALVKTAAQQIQDQATKAAGVKVKTLSDEIQTCAKV